MIIIDSNRRGEIFVFVEVNKHSSAHTILSKECEEPPDRAQINMREYTIYKFTNSKNIPQLTLYL